MKSVIKVPVFLVLFLVLTAVNLRAQFIQNPSLEGPTGEHVVPAGWSGCKNFSTPDTQPGAWNVFSAASHGSTFMSLVVRGDNGQPHDRQTEAAETRLQQPLLAGKCYRFSIDLARSATFFSNVFFITPAKLRVYAGATSCAKTELLWESPVISQTNWTRFSFNFQLRAPSAQYLILEAIHDGNTFYNGNIQIDNLALTEENLVVNLGADRTICSKGAPVVLTAANPNATYLWHDGTTSPTFTVTGPGLVWVEVRNGNCMLRDEINFTNVPPIAVDLGPDTVLCEAESYILDATVLNGNYLWNDGNILPRRTITASGTYEVKVRNSCEEVTDKVTVIFKESCCEIETFNIFTPNQDGINDEFKLKAIYPIADYHLRIFNRWGGLVFETTSIDKGWNGYAGNSKNNEGVYFWTLSYNCKEKRAETRKSLKGYVTLVR